MHRRLQIANEVASKASLTSPGCFLETGRDFKHFNIFWSKFGWMNISRTSCFFQTKTDSWLFCWANLLPPKKSTFKNFAADGLDLRGSCPFLLGGRGLKDRTPMVSWPVFFLWVSGVWVETAKGDRGQWPCWHEWHEGGTFFLNSF